MAKKEICCICGKVIEDDILEGNNPDPLRDEEGNFLSQGENPCCCKHCDSVYVTSYRISEAYGLKNQCELTQKKVLELRKGWLHKTTYKEVDCVGVKGKLCKVRVKTPIKHYGRMIIVTEMGNEMKSIVICPHCGRLVNYGHTATHCGIHGCEFCIDELSTTIELDRKYNYEAYAKKANNFEYEPYRYKED